MQPNLLKDVVANFRPEETHFELNKGHGRIEKRTVSICQPPEAVRHWPGLQTLIRIESERQLTKGGLTIIMTEVRYYIASFKATAQEFARRIRGYWGVENKVHYVRDVTQGEDRSRIRITPLPSIFALRSQLCPEFIPFPSIYQHGSSSTAVQFWSRHTRATF